MKFLAYLTLVLAVFAAPVVVAEDDGSGEPAAADTREAKRQAKEEAKEAKVWIKKQMALKKKTLSALKRVKDEKSAKKAAKTIQKLYGTDEGEETAMGTVGPEKAPSGEVMDKLMEKEGPKLEKLDEAIDAEVERISGLEIESPELDKALEAL